MHYQCKREGRPPILEALAAVGIKGVVDTLPLLRAYRAANGEAHLGSTLGDMVEVATGQKFEGHRAALDTRASFQGKGAF